MTSKHQVLLLGGEGFIGRNIIETLGGNFNCTSTGISRSPFPKSTAKYVELNPYTTRLTEDFNTVIHLIDNNIDLKNFEQSELKLTKNIHLKSGAHLILFSSSVIYANPNSEYGQRKLLLEKIYEKYCAKNNINLSIIRLFNTYGKYQVPYKQGSLVANIFYNYLNKIPIEINDIEATRDFLYASDIGKFIKYIINQKHYGIVNIASENRISIKDLITTIQEQAIKKDLHINNKLITENIVCPTANNQIVNKIKITSLTLGLIKTFSFYKKNQDIIKEYLIK